MTWILTVGGLCSEVFKCQHKVTKDIVALKKLRPDVEKNGVRANFLWLRLV